MKFADFILQYQHSLAGTLSLFQADFVFHVKFALRRLGELSLTIFQVQYL
jgi:hypothetical protein